VLFNTFHAAIDSLYGKETGIESAAQMLTSTYDLTGTRHRGASPPCQMSSALTRGRSAPHEQTGPH